MISGAHLRVLEESKPKIMNRRFSGPQSLSFSHFSCKNGKGLMLKMGENRDLNLYIPNFWRGQISKYLKICLKKLTYNGSDEKVKGDQGTLAP